MKRVAFNFSAEFIGRVVGTVFGLLTVGIMTRYLGVEGFGKYTTIVTFASIFGIMADFGMVTVTSQLINRAGIDERKYLSNLISYRALSALVVVGLAPVLVWLFPYSYDIKLGVVIFSLSFWTYSMTQIFVALHQKHLRTYRLALIEGLTSAFRLVAVLVASWLGWGIIGIVIAMVLTNIAVILLQWLSSRSVIKFGWAWDKLIWLEIFSLSWPLILTIISNLIYLKADIFILSLARTQQEVGLYGAAYKVVDILVSLPFIFAGLMLPILVKLKSDADKGKFTKATQVMFDLAALSALPIFWGGLVLSDQIMVVIAGHDYLLSGSLLRILLLAVVAVFFSCILTHAMVGLERQRALVPYFIVTALVSMPTYYFLIKFYGYYGAAWGTVISEILICVFAWHGLVKSGIKALNLRKSFRSLAAAMLMAVVIWPLAKYADSLPILLAECLLGLVVYVALALWFKAFEKQDLAEIKGE